MRIESPYHAGELLVQERVGVLSEGASNSRVIQDSILKGALRFLNQQGMEACLGSPPGTGRGRSSTEGEDANRISISCR